MFLWISHKMDLICHYDITDNQICTIFFTLNKSILKYSYTRDRPKTAWKPTHLCKFGWKTTKRIPLRTVSTGVLITTGEQGSQQTPHASQSLKYLLSGVYNKNVRWTLVNTIACAICKTKEVICLISLKYANDTEVCRLKHKLRILYYWGDKNVLINLV